MSGWACARTMQMQIEQTTTPGGIAIICAEAMPAMLTKSLPLTYSATARCDRDEPGQYSVAEATNVLGRNYHMRQYMLSARPI